MYFIILIAVLTIVILFWIHWRYEVSEEVRPVDAYEAFKKTRIGQKVNSEMVIEEDSLGGGSAKNPHLRQTVRRYSRKRAEDTRQDMRRQLVKYREERRRERLKEESPLQQILESPSAEPTESKPAANMVIPIVEETKEDRSSSQGKTGRICGPPVIPNGAQSTYVHTLSRDTDRFDGKFFKPLLENSTLKTEDKSESKDEMTFTPSPPRGYSPPPLTSLGETVNQISELESLCQEIDHIIEVIQEKNGQDKGVEPHFTKHLEEHVNHAFSSGKPVDVAKLVEDLQIPSPSDLLKRNVSPGRTQSKRDTVADQYTPPSHQSSDPRTSESIEIWKKMLGFK
jgi:hypothetical protein